MKCHLVIVRQMEEILLLKKRITMNLLQKNLMLSHIFED